MARIKGNNVMKHFSGRIDMLCFYQVYGKTYIRMVSSLSGKRVKKDKAFRRTMENAALLGRASRVGSAVYRALPKTFRQFWMYKAFTGEAMQLLREGKTNEEAHTMLWKTYAEVWVMKEETAKAQASLAKHKAISHTGKKLTTRRPKTIIVSSLPFGRPVYQQEEGRAKTVVKWKIDGPSDNKHTTRRAREPAVAGLELL